MAQKQFGNIKYTGKKLDVIREYLSMYQTALSKTSFKTIYIDGFAGSGEVPLTEHRDELFDEEVKTVLAGSAHNALNISPPFDGYTFIDKRKACIETLKSKYSNSRHSSRILFLTGDANSHIRKICQSEQWHSQRGVVLLDPFGSQVEWATIEAIAATEALDLWYLFPAGLSIFRQIGNDGTVDPSHEPSITRLLGTEDWKKAFFKPSDQTDLFESGHTQEKIVTAESAAQYMIDRLKTIFKGVVMEEMIPLGKHSYPSYYLLFAMGNPSENATRLARRLSKAAIKATDRKNGRII